MTSSGLEHVRIFSKRTVIQTNILFSVLQVLLVLLALACVVLAGPQNVEVNRQFGRPRTPRHRHYSSPYYPRPTILPVPVLGPPA